MSPDQIAALWFGGVGTLLILGVGIFLGLLDDEN